MATAKEITESITIAEGRFYLAIRKISPVQQVTGYYNIHFFQSPWFKNIIGHDHYPFILLLFFLQVLLINNSSVRGRPFILASFALNKNPNSHFLSG